MIAKFFKRLLSAAAILTARNIFTEIHCPLEHAAVGIYAVRCSTGEVLIDQNSDLSLIPASCMKIVTTAAALHLLGADHRFETYLEYDGYIDPERTLQGNLYIRGGGDPCLGSDRIPGNPGWEKQIDAWVKAVQKLGVRKITGNVIGDAAKWEKALATPSWTWEDLGNYYGAGACALSFNENRYSLFFKPGRKPGEAASILRTDPPLPQLIFRNEVTTGAEGSGDRACIYGCELATIQAVRGTIPAGVREFAIKGAIPEPAEHCADLLSKGLQENGIPIEQQAFAPQSERTFIHITISPTVKEIVHWTNQESINLYAEHLLKCMGEAACREGSTRAGIEAVTTFWKSQQLGLGGFHMADGSGLSRKNLMTAKQFVSILLKMKKSDHFPIFYASLPQQNGPMRAKSGSMSLIKGYAGYTGDIAFAVIINQCMEQLALNNALNAFLSHLNQLNP